MWSSFARPAHSLCNALTTPVPVPNLQPLSSTATTSYSRSNRMVDAHVAHILNVLKFPVDRKRRSHALQWRRGGLFVPLSAGRTRPVVPHVSVRSMPIGGEAVSCLRPGKYLLFANLLPNQPSGIPARFHAAMPGNVSGPTSPCSEAKAISHKPQGKSDATGFPNRGGMCLAGIRGAARFRDCSSQSTKFERG